ncbi:ABC transporter ATP-binding protein [Paenibacillus sp. J2TS4]|uniref:ABC transporter ATP-binding protein n=1 Tax=Paenibacillus sp. J2TS4 TaxID=2807194 RepID=UPI001B1E75F1|nr:ABC transporter ATP-binding protein [Paenibacillus sp. J2TS4]GIP32649.1 putative ABC transporter ATP-binding protein YknV [Paenibacillus sp. J2TS4]
MSSYEWDSEEEQDKPFNKQYLARMFGYLKPHKRTMIFVSIIVVINMLLSLAEPILIRYAIDEGMVAKNLTVIHLVGIGLLALRLAGWLLGVLQIRLVNFTGQRILFELRQQLFNHLQSLSFRFFDGRPAGKIMSRITNDTNAIGELINGGLITLLMETTHLVGIVVILLYWDWKLALMAFTVLPFLYLLVSRFRPKIESSWLRSRRTISAINGNVNETIQGIRVIQAFSRQETNNRRFHEINSKNRKAFMKAVSLESFVWPLVELIGMIGTCLVVWYGAIRVLNGDLTVGFIVAFINYLWRFWGPLSSLSKVYSQLLSAMASADRIFEILDTKPEVKDAPNAKPLPPIRGRVVFDQVSFRYAPDKPEVLRTIQLDTKPGQRIAIVGPTGAGKSTIVNMLMRFYDPTSGKVLIDGHDIKEVSLASLRSQIGIVLQDSFIFSGTIEENLRYGKKDATLEEIERAARSVRIDRLVEKFPNGYQTQVEERGSMLSVGQRQLLAFGRVLLADPKILILDEATSSVDTETEQHIQEALTTLLEGRTAFIIAHRLSTIRDADVILVIEQGRIAESGSHDELLGQQGIYANLYYNQFLMQQSLAQKASGT